MNKKERKQMSRGGYILFKLIVFTYALLLGLYVTQKVLTQYNVKPPGGEVFGLCMFAILLIETYNELQECMSQ